MPDIFMDPALFAEAPLGGSPSSFWLVSSSSSCSSSSSSDEDSSLSKAVKQVKIASPKTKKQKQPHVPPQPQYVISPEPQYIHPQQLDLSSNALGIFDSTSLNINIQSLFPTPIAPAPPPAPAPKKKSHTPSKPKSQVVHDPLRNLKIHKRQHLELLLDSLNNFIPGKVFTKHPNPPVGTYKHVPIGAHTSNPKSNIRDEWTCLFTPAGAGPGQPPCNRKLRSLATQIYHFYWEHHPFDGMELISRCKGCGSGWRDGPSVQASGVAGAIIPPPACPHCGGAGPHDKVLWGALVEVSGVKGKPGATFIVEKKKPDEAAGAVEDEDDASASATVITATSGAATATATTTIKTTTSTTEEEAVTASTLGGGGVGGGGGGRGVGGPISSSGIEARVVDGDDDNAVEKIPDFQLNVDDEMDMWTWSTYVDLGMSLDQVESLRYTF